MGARFSAPVHIGCADHAVSYTVGTGSFLGVKRARRDVNHPPLSSVEVKEKGRGIPLIPFCAFMAGYEVEFTFTFTLLLPN